MKQLPIISIITFFLLGAMTVQSLAAPASNPKKNPPLQIAVDVTTAPEPSPTTAPKPSVSLEPSAQPTLQPTAAPEPTAVPTTAPTPEPITSPAPVEQQPPKETKNPIDAAIGQIMSQIEDTPTPTPTPEPVQIIQGIVVKDTPSEHEKKDTAPAEAVKKIQQIIGPSASFFLHSVPGNYYLMNSLSKTQSASLLLIAFLLMGSGAVLLYKTQREELRNYLESFATRYILPFWSRQKHIFYTIFDRDYAK